MARVKRGVAKRRRHKRILDEAKGYYGARGHQVRSARLQVTRSGQFAYRDRKQRKRQFRSLWVARINAAVREHGLSYSRFVAGLKAAAVEIDRKQLAALALADPAAFGRLVEVAKGAAA
jgi:large subunit ribosomal protein L20